MQFTCPHCGKPFEQNVRKASHSEKANAARARNALLGGPTPKVSEDVLTRIFLVQRDCGPTRFAEAVEKETGYRYSVPHASRLLQHLTKKTQ